MDKIQKKLISVILISIMIIMVLTIKNYATTSTNVYLEVPTSGKSGDEITVIVKTNGSTEGVTGVQGTFNYDQNQLQYVSNTILKDGWFVSGFNEETGIFLLEVSDVTDKESFIYEDTEVASFTFRVKDGAISQNTVIELDDIVAPGAEQVENTQTSETISINGGDSKSNTSSTNSQINNTQNSSTYNYSNSNSVSTTYMGKNGETKMPFTGTKSYVIILAFILLSISAVSIFEYLKYKDI